MKPILATVFLLSVFGFASCGAEGGSPSAPASDAASAASSNDSAKPAEKNLPKIVAFGDSLTAGYGLDISQSYPSLLQKRLNAEGYAYEVVNAGVSGDTTAGGLRRIDWALEGGAKILILELGANDILRGQPISEMKKNLSQIIERARARGAEPLLAGMEAPTNSGPEYRKEVREAFQSLAKEHNLRLIPFFLDRVAGMESLNQADGVHPNAEGTKIVAETVYQALQPMLKR